MSLFPRSFWLSLATGFFAAEAAHAQASCELGQPAENMPREFAQFDFIIGDFDVRYQRMTENGWSEPYGKAR